MAYKYQVEVLDFSNLREIEGAWKPSDFRALLDAMEFEGQEAMSDDEVREMCLMSLQDQEPDEAAYLVLKHVIGDELKDSQLRNMSHEMASEKLWEEYVDPAYHERLFNAGSILFAALSRTFPKTDAVQLRLKVTAVDDCAFQLLQPAPTESLLVRLLADGMEQNAVLRRLYAEQLTGSSFPNAAEIVWIANTQQDSQLSCTLTVIGSGYWLDALEYIKSYGTNAYADDREPTEA